MARYVKCQICCETVDYNKRLELMEIDTKVSSTTGKSRNLYYHKDKCWETFNKNQSFILDELAKKDELNDVMKSLYNIKFQIPNRIWEMLQDLRNGTNRYQKFFKKKYKEGVPYEVMAEAYRMSKDSILWARLNRRFRDKEEELRYGLRVMQSKIEDAHAKIKRSELVKKTSDAKLDRDLADIVENREATYKKKELKDDLSSLLGDD